MALAGVRPGAGEALPSLTAAPTRGTRLTAGSSFGRAGDGKLSLALPGDLHEVY